MKRTNYLNSSRLAAWLLIAFVSVTFGMGCHFHLGDYTYHDDGKQINLLNKTFQSTAGEKLTVGTESGAISVTTWDKNEVQVVILGDENAEEYFTWNAEKVSGGVNVELKKKSSSWFHWSHSFHIKVIVPKTYDVNGKTSGGDIKLANLTGRVSIATSGGDIAVAGLKGTLNCTTSGGDIKLKGVDGPVNGSTSGGNIHVENFTDNISVSTSGGDINMEGTNGSIDATTSGGNVNVIYTGENKGIKLSTSGGEVNLRLKKETKGNISLSTSGGDVSCDIPTSHVTTMKSRKLVGEINGGGPEIDLHTSGGDVKLEKISDK